MLKRARFARPQSDREKKEAINNAHRLVAAMCSDPEKRARYEAQFVKELPPKRDKVRRPVDGRPVKPTEYQEQGAVIDWWWKAHKLYGVPEFALFSVPNGAYLASGYAGAAMLKKTGMRKGAPDLILAKPTDSYHGLYIEMKSEDGRESPEQREFGAYLESAGYKFLFCYGAASAIKAIEEYLA